MSKGRLTPARISSVVLRTGAPYAAVITSGGHECHCGPGRNTACQLCGSYSRRVASIFEAMHMQDEIIAMSLNYAGVQKLRSLRPSWRVGLLSSVAIGDLTQLDADFFAINGRFDSLFGDRIKSVQ